MLSPRSPPRMLTAGNEHLDELSAVVEDDIRRGRSECGEVSLHGRVVVGTVAKNLDVLALEQLGEFVVGGALIAEGNNTSAAVAQDAHKDCGLGLDVDADSDSEAIEGSARGESPADAADDRHVIGDEVELSRDVGHNDDRTTWRFPSSWMGHRLVTRPSQRDPHRPYAGSTDHRIGDTNAHITQEHIAARRSAGDVRVPLRGSPRSFGGLAPVLRPR